MDSDQGKYHIPKEEEGEVLPNKLDLSDPEKIGKKETEGLVVA